ncbi:esterase-like activity of phytase family protein [Mycobacterium sp. 21AC1]|uniref:esterase-like activity of phytase family protein n=1 Tax=[Mycobacterium] appelbergii TaxID=2939269 RepID=UPI002938F8EE|nr:esterase-like activity of phytase family protein [Mycobacterium sp. 21AC1]MDV3128339.1 esterase-like activity of phytase family protein [Mycobacterium sp. 21AC1]
MLGRILLAGALILAGCATPPGSAPELHYLGQTQLRAGMTLDHTLIGGLSGISYDPAGRQYYIVSDDRSAKAPARFYTARIPVSGNGIGDVEFVETRPWLDRDGRPFGPLDAAAHPPVIPPDAEGIAFDPQRQRLYWSSEGERREDGVRLDPWVRIGGLDGGYLGEFVLPDPLLMTGPDHGARQNKALEGLSLSPDGRHLWAAMEGPVSQDGPLPDEHHGALTRITRFDVETGAADAEYTYPLDPVSAGPGGDNGLSDLVALDDGTFLIIERGYGTHVSARIYRARITEGSTELTKTLAVDLTATPGLSPLDNIEGITLGPKLPDGRQSVILVSDDNFSPTQVTQFLLFAM